MLNSRFFSALQGTVLITNAEELTSYSRSEEDKIEELVRGIADAGARVVVAGSAIGEMAMHFLEKYGIMVIRIPSKFDLRRFCRCDPFSLWPFSRSAFELAELDRLLA